MWYDSLLGIGSTPDSTAANSTLNGAASSNGSSFGSFLSGIGNLASTGVADYAAIKGATSGSKSSSSTSTTASTLANAKWLPWALIGGVVLVIVALLFKRGR